MKLLFAILAIAIHGIIPEPAFMEVHKGSCEVKDNIVCTIDKTSGIAKEGYVIKVDRRKIRIRASTPAGIFYAKQTLKQLEQDGRVPCVWIEDAPRFAWRGFMVDPCRHFLSVEDLKKQIDVLAKYKINVMHWHLTDDQGWRIEIKKYPRLTEVGAWRTEFDGSVHGGFYTQDEIREVVAYAAERFVTVVPEIEMPGHAISAIRAYPWLSCTGEALKTFYTWGTPDISLCVGDDRIFSFLEDVIAEVVELFPSEYIHIGGDECRKNRWETCPKCQARIKAEGLVSDENGTAEEKLQSYAVHRMETILNKYGRKLIGWDEILEGGLTPGATVMSWRGEAGGIKAALEGHEVVMTPGKDGLYLDHYQGDPKIEPVTIGGMTTLEKVYNYDPVPAELSRNGKGSLVKGVQCNNWSEYMYTNAKREYMMFPRAFALAEIAWTAPGKKNFESFCKRVDAACQDLDERGMNYHIPLPEQPEGSCDNIAMIDRTSLSFKTTRPMKMVYTLDGSTPTASSAEYVKPLEFTEDAVLKIASVTSYGKLSPVRTITIDKQEPLPAIKDVFEGIRARRADGRFYNARELEGAEWRPIELESFKGITKLEPYNRNLPDSTVFYAVEAESCFSVDGTDIYRFSSDCDRVWIDGRLIIDNSEEEAKRFSRHDIELALAEGEHSVRVLYIFNVRGGWNPLRNSPEVMIRKKGNVQYITTN